MQIDAGEALASMSILALAALVGGLMLTQVLGWGTEWNAWLSAQTDAEGHRVFSDAAVTFMGRLPMWMTIFYGLAVLALASPRPVLMRR